MSSRSNAALPWGDQAFRLLVEGVKDYAIFMLDPQGYITTWNSGAEKIKGYTAEEIIGQHFSRFYPPEDVQANKMADELAVAVRDGRFEEEGWRVRKDGSRFWANVVITALFDPDKRLIGFAKVTRDLTVRRQVDEERLRRAQAEEAVRLRDVFMSMASHEINTPLTALQLQLDGVRRRVEALDAQVVKRVDGAIRSTDRLADLVRSLLDVSRIATGRLDLVLERCDLPAVARDVVEGMCDMATQVGSELSLTGEQALVGRWDRLRIEQVVMNLVSNAIKHAPGGPITVSVRRDGERAVLQVRDRGPGTLPADLARIFERFERMASMRGTGGLGLGLYLTREIVNGHGGVVSAENVAEGGMCFTVRLPLDPPPRAQQSPVAHRDH